jgi:hypothetical protein
LKEVRDEVVFVDAEILVVRSPWFTVCVSLQCIGERQADNAKKQANKLLMFITN